MKYPVIFLLFASFALSCSMNPALLQRGASDGTFNGTKTTLLAEGERLWGDPNLSAKQNVSCTTCHFEFSAFNPSFAEPYPHRVAMVESRTGLKRVNAEQMVQFCMLAPMGRKEPLPWDSRELAALTAYTLKLQKEFQAKKGN